MIFLTEAKKNLGAVGKFLFAAAGFMAATATAVCYQLDISRINLWLAMAFVLGCNLPRLDGKKYAIAGLTALVLALTALILPARVWCVWLFMGFMTTAFLLSDKPFAYAFIYIAAFFNLSFITNTAYSDVQYDFASCYNYIEYILDNNFLFWRENPILTRPSYSAYHPILHFFSAAGIIRVVQMFTDNVTAAAETAQVLFCFYMLWYYLIAVRILQILKVHGGAFTAGAAFVCFFPIYNAIAGFFNNDCLLLPLQAGAVYYALLYYQAGGRKNLFFIFLFITAAALTKLSGILVLPAIALALGLKLWQERSKTVLLELTFFGVCVLAGISLWPLYQHFVLELSAGFVPPQEHLSLKTYSLWERFNPLGAFVYERMFYNDFGINLWETMTKTALFGQWDFSYRGAKIMSLITALVWLYKGILCLIVLAVVYLLATNVKNVYLWIALFLLGGLLCGQVLFGLMHPYMCNQDFRYVALLPLPFAMILTTAADKQPLRGKRGAAVLLYGFAATAAFVWWYVGAMRI